MKTVELELTGGIISADGVTAGDAGDSLDLVAGAGNATYGDGGSVNITAGSAPAAGDGGDINILPGSGTISSGSQEVDVGGVRVGGDATGLTNDATVYAAAIVIDGGSSQPIAVTGSAAQTYTTLLSELNADTTGATWSIAGGNLLATSDSSGATSTVAITDTDLFSSLTDFVAVNAAIGGSNGSAGKTKVTSLEAPLPINTQTGTAYTAIMADASKVITLNNAAAIAMTIPANASVPYPIGTKLNFEQLGAGAVTVGITSDTLSFNAGATAVMNGQYSIATALKIAATEWVLFGQLVPANPPLTSVAISDLDDGTDGELITWDASGVATTVPAGTATQVLTSNGAGAEPTFQTVGAAGSAANLATTGADVNVDLSAPPTTGQVLVATSATTSTWQTPAATGIANVVEDTTPQLGGQLDVNGNAIGDGTLELITFTETGSAVNQVNITNAATGTAPIIGAAGGDANVDISIQPKGTGDVVLGTLTIDGDQTIGAGQDNFVMTYDNGTGLVSLEAAAGGGGISNVVEDTTPQLGGALDVNGFDIESINGGDITLSPGVGVFTAGTQEVDVGGTRVGGDVTGLLNDATVYTAAVVVDGGASQPIAVTGSAAQSYTTLLSELNTDTTGAVWSLVGGNLLLTSSSTGVTSTIAITDTDLFSTLTTFVAVNAAVAGTGSDGAIVITDTAAPTGTTVNKLYSVAGALTWNGTDLTVSGVSQYDEAFTNATLTAGVLTVTHSLGRKFVQVAVYNNNDDLIQPDTVTATSTTVTTIDLSSFGTLTGTWNVVII